MGKFTTTYCWTFQPMGLKKNRAMNNMKTLGLLLLFGAGILAACQPPIPTKPAIEAGVSVAPINPPLNAYIAGDRQDRKFTSVHDSLFAKAVVITNGEEQVALVTLDCIGLLYPEVQRIRKRAAERCGFDESRIIISSTHTHSGPDVVGIWGSDYQHSGVDSAYMEFLVNTAAEQVQKAWATKRPATVVTAETEFGEPWVQNICMEEIDRSASILQFRDEAGHSIATLTNFACHPTFLDARFSEVSADYVHGYYKTLEKLTGGEALFLQGAIGGWVQPEDGEGSFEKAFKRGKELAEAVHEVLPSAKMMENPNIRFKSSSVRFPVENKNWQQLAAIGTINRPLNDSVSSEISWFAIGDAEFATHPGETAPYYGLETKKLMVGDGPKFILGLGNDAMGYILKPSFFEDKDIPHADYLTSMSVGKPTGPLLMEGLAKIIPSQK